MKNAAILLLLTFVFVSARAVNPDLPTQTVRGTVTDKLTHTSLPGANVVILNTNPVVGTATDIDGKFKLTKVTVGRVSLKITFMGYKDVILSNLNLNTGKELVIEAEMEENIILQKGVEIRAERNKANAGNEMTTVSSRSFTVEETQRYAGSRNDVARMASNYAGMTGSNDARNDIIIRGNSPLGLLWRMEGVEIPNPNHWGSPTSSGGPVCMINNNVLSNSDFLTGAFPAEYGNAVSGVFDLKMRNGNNEKHEFLGQIGFNGVEAGAEGPISREHTLLPGCFFQNQSSQN
ncbi:MAG: carboxypeptidase-like regulatory domain-containing protein [Bacteroidetes bacterium]|nr:carboxypeptidase-like regulatory domain-containing protein [Bacteroidota bacterium]